jgi:hypothetical protein
LNDVIYTFVHDLPPQTNIHSKHKRPGHTWPSHGRCNLPSPCAYIKYCIHFRASQPIVNFSVVLYRVDKLYSRKAINNFG